MFKKLAILQVMLFFYKKYIYFDFDELNKVGKIVITPAWFVRASLLWLIFFFLYPLIFYRYKYDKQINDFYKMAGTVKYNMYLAYQKNKKF
jgi:hypothetical protein